MNESNGNDDERTLALFEDEVAGEVVGGGLTDGVGTIVIGIERETPAAAAASISRATFRSLKRRNRDVLCEFFRLLFDPVGGDGVVVVAVKEFKRCLRQRC